MKTLKKLLDERPARAALSVSPDDTVFSALELMARHDIGAVLVMREIEFIPLTENLVQHRWQ